MNVKILVRAEQRFESIYSYIKLTFGHNAAERFKEEINTILNLLANNPEAGHLQFPNKLMRGFLVNKKTIVV